MLLFRNIEEIEIEIHVPDMNQSGGSPIEHTLINHHNERDATE
jgi:hypothetical protein